MRNYTSLTVGLLGGIVAIACGSSDGDSSGASTKAGADGVNALMSVSDEEAGDNCENGGAKIEYGADANADGKLNSDEIEDTQYICGAAGEAGEQGETGPQGSAGGAGPQGDPGAPSLIRMTPEFSGSNCESGGVRIEVGLDDNDSGALDDLEVDDTSYVCNGVSPSCSGSLVAGAPILLDTSWSAQVNSNFHPNSFAYDEAESQFIYGLQGARQIRVSDTAGVLVDTVALSSTGQHMTGIAADADYYYFSDYTGNTGGADLFRVAKTGGTPEQISSEIAAFGGYPLVVGNGTMFRANLSTTYNWSNLTTVRVSDVDTPDVITNSYTVAAPRGIGDMAWDGEALWVLDYVHTGSNDRTADLYKVDPETGAILATHLDVYTGPANVYPAGLTHDGSRLWLFNYSENNAANSTIVPLFCD